MSNVNLFFIQLLF